MWKSTSLASVSQLRTKRIEGPSSAVPPARAEPRADLAGARRLGGGSRPPRPAPGPRAGCGRRRGSAPRGSAARRRRRSPSNASRGWPALSSAKAEQAVARRVIGPLLDRLAVAVDRQRQRGARPRSALEPLAGEPAHVGAAGEEIDDRAVGAGRVGARRRAPRALAERDQREHVARIALAPGEARAPAPRAAASRADADRGPP